MRKFYFLAFFLFAQKINAQKSVDLDRHNVRVQYRSLPAMQIDSAYRTYNVEAEGTRLMQPMLNDMAPENSVELEGWRKLPQNGHIQIKVRIGDLLPGDVSIKERIVNTKNGNGQVNGTKTYYWQEVTYTFESSATITDYKGMHLQNLELAGRNYKQVYKSPEFTVRALAEGYFVVNSIAVTKELFSKCVTRAMQTLSEKVTESYGYSEVTVSDNLWVVGSRKHPEYANSRKAMMQLNEVLFSMNASTPINGAREQLKPVIDYFEKIKRTYASGNRHDRKIRYASYYNLAVLYYYLDDPQAMMKEASGLVLNDFDTKDGKAFEQTATWLKNLFERTNIYTRHFPVNTEKFKGPYEKEDVTKIK